MILAATLPGMQHYLERDGTGWLSVRILRISGILCHDTGGLNFKWGSTIKPPMSAHSRRSLPNAT